MKTMLLAVVFTAALFSACNQENKATTGIANASQQATSEQASSTSVATTGKEITDPVCGMVKDSTWTDYTLYKGDTVWFCSAPEKEAFIAKPEKYAQQVAPHSSN